MDNSVIFAAALIGAIVCELVLQLTWNKAYFRSGLPLLSIVKQLSPGAASQRDFIALVNRVTRKASARIVFHTLSDTELAFREGILGGGLSPAIMRGLLIFDRSEGKLRLKGYAYWHMLVLLLDWAGYLFYVSRPPSQGAAWLSLALPMLFIAVGYPLQARRFRKILKLAVQVWEEAASVPPNAAPAADLAQQRPRLVDKQA